MARKKKYGKTWWGNAWVEALERIDYNTNRLPRGRSYAGGGRVREIKIDAEGTVRAKVQGNRAAPYKIEINLREFSPREKKAAAAITAADPVLAAELSLGLLPEKMLQSLEQKNIPLLPEAWSDIEARCSCPDWANPCKHLAAVYYIIANEIDKDPFILFKLRKVDVGELMRAAGFAGRDPGAAPGRPLRTEGIWNGPPSFTPYQEVKSAPGAEPPAEVPEELSALTRNRDSAAFFALLGEAPLFYPHGNFKTLLLQAYKNISRSMEKIELRENGFSFKDWSLTLLYPSAGELKKLFSGKHRERRPGQEFSFFAAPLKPAPGEENPVPPHPLLSAAGAEEKTLRLPRAEGEKTVLKRKKGVLLPAQTVWDLFLSLPLQPPGSRTSPGARFLSAAAAVAQALAQSSSFVPVLRSPDPEETEKAREKTPGNFYVVYKPLDRSGKLQRVADYLVSIMPPGFIFCPKEKGVLEGPAAVEELLTLALTGIAGRYAGIDPEADDKVARAFFCGAPYRAEKFEEKQTAKAISDWLGRLNPQPAGVAPVLKIDPPLPGQEKFTLRLYVENRRDPLAPVLPLSKVFSAREQLFSLPVEQVRRETARQLTIAGEHIPILKKLLRHKGKKRAALSPATLAEFLTGGRQVCSLLGIKVMIPRDLQHLAAPRLALAAKAAPGPGKTVSYFNLDEMLEFSWQVSLGDVTMTGEEFCRLAESAAGVVRFKDRYLLLKPEEVGGILDKLNAPAPQLPAMEALRSAVTGEAAEAVFKPGRLLQQLADKLVAPEPEKVSLPAGLKAELRPYQQRGFRWLYHNTVNGLGSCLADDMGLGKTLQVLALLLKLKEEGRLEKPALVVCPTTLIGNWVKECRKFTPALEAAVYHGSSRRLSTKGTDLVITSYGILRRETARFKRNRWDLAVIDEAQNIKNPESAQTKAVKSLAAKSRIAVSGTPVENRLVELWSIFDFINRGYLGKRRDFTGRFALPIEKYRDGEKTALLRKATAPFLLRRLKSDRAIIKDLPPKVVKEENCYLTKEQAALYQQVVEQVLEEIERSEGIARKGLVFKLMTALKQICNHPAQYSKKGKAVKEHSGKAAKTLDLLEQILAGGEKALLFTQYRQMGQLLAELIREELREEALFFHGGVSRSQRDLMVENFQSNQDSAPVMVVSLKAGGTGLNLTAATHVIHYDLWWNPAAEDQATDRTYRIGQTRTVMVHRLVSLGTFEEKINTMMAAKKELAELVVTAGESSLSELSNQELRELFKLET